MNFFKLFVLAFLLSLAPVSANADVWQGPPGNPPSNNRNRPVDTSADPQTKAGNLTISGTLTASGDFNAGTSNAFQVSSAGVITLQSTANFTTLANFTAGINVSNPVGHGVYGTSAANAFAGVYGANTGTGWAGYFNGPVGASSYMVVGGVVNPVYSNNGDLYLYGKAGIAGSVVNSLGSAALPSYTFSGDTNTGIYSSAADTINFSTGGAERVQINSAGLVTFNGQVKITGGTPEPGKVLTSDAAGLATWGNAVAGAAGADTQVQFNNAGSLGADAGLTYNIDNNNDTTLLNIAAPNPYNGEIRINRAPQTVFAGLSLYTVETISWFMGIPYNSGNNESGFSIGQSKNKTSAQIYISPSAGVGIGTYDPQFKLDVNGTANVNNMVTLGRADLNVAAGQNLLYGNMDTGSAGNLLLLQTEGADKFKVDKYGNLSVGTNQYGQPSAIIGNYVPYDYPADNDDDSYPDVCYENQILKVTDLDGNGTYRWICAADNVGGLADNAVTNAKMADNAIGNAEMLDNAINTVEIIDNAVTTAKIADLNVTAGKIANNTITVAQIATDGVGALEIAAGAVGTSEIGTNGVAADEIAAGAVGTSEIGTNGVAADEIAAGAVGTSEIQDGTITGTDIASPLSLTGDLTIQGGGLTGSNSELISLGETDNVISFTSGGAERIRIHSNGNFGIRSNAPGYPLHVIDDDSTAIINIDNVGADLWTGLRIARDATEKWFIGVSNTTDQLIFRRNNGTNDLTIETNGDVTTAGDIKVGGGDIKNSADVSSIQFSGGNVIIKLGE